jgi:hypothetical protein
MHKTFLFVLSWWLLGLVSCQQEAQLTPALVPQPQEVYYNEGTVTFKSMTVVNSNDFVEECKTLAKYFRLEKEAFRLKLTRSEVSNPHNYKGAYELTVNAEVEIKAADKEGFFYGIQTLRQLVQERDGQYVVPQCNIKDWPAFKVRGFMHDVGRNFMSMDLLKQNIEILANYKYNVFHFHVTENPGWRLESKVYPQLQDSSTFTRKPGQYYSQKDFKELIRFCSERHITLIPEFDIPGHSAAFRKAFKLKSMNEPKVQSILVNLINELCRLAPAEVMPYIHLGTDEVRHKEEKVKKGFLDPVVKAVYDNGREVIGWHPGMDEVGGKQSIKQLWTGMVSPLKGHRYIDSRANYINHIDPLAALYRFAYQQPCRKKYGDKEALGGVLCLWHDNNIEDEVNFFRQNPTYPSIVMYSDAIWHGRKNYDGDKYWAQMPEATNTAYNDGKQLEEKVIAHRDRFFKGIPFPYIRHTHIPWKIIGPFNHGGNLNKVFPVEQELKDKYVVDGNEISWNRELLHGGTIHLNHFFGFPSPVKEKTGTVYAYTSIYSKKQQQVGFWIGFHGWSRAGGRRGGPTPEIGQWHTTNPKIWINNKEIAPPKWKQPGLEAKTSEIPMVDEDYFYRKPTKVILEKGWNKILLKVPHGGTSWKWMFTCVPVEVNRNSVREVKGLRYSVSFR